MYDKENAWKQLDTPALVVDVGKLKYNIEEYQKAVSAYGVALRPHINTHKMPRIAHMQLAAGAKGVVAAKLGEAEVMADGGVDDIFIAYPIIGREKLDRLSALNRRLRRLLVEVDSLEGGRQLSEQAIRNGEIFNVVAEVDVVGAHRTGFSYETAEEEILKLSSLPGLNVMGLFAYAYMTTRNGTATSPEEAGVSEGRLTVELAGRLRARGLDLEMVAGGSSPTGRYVASVPGITEVHPGTYVFYDAMSKFYGIGASRCAAYIVATVVSVGTHHACIDAGSKTFSTDLVPDCPPLNLEGYGVILDHEDLRLDHLSEEHGIILKKDGGPMDLRIGTKLRIIPNHICPCLALHDHAWFLTEQGSLEKVSIDGRGKLT